MAILALVEKTEVPNQPQQAAEVVRLVPAWTPYRRYRSSPEDFARELAAASAHSSTIYAAWAHYYY